MAVPFLDDAPHGSLPPIDLDFIDPSREAAWTETMLGFSIGSTRTAHHSTESPIEIAPAHGREAREAEQEEHLRRGATRALGSGTRAIAEDPDALRTCFERDRDRILHSFAFRRLAGKTQVFIFPDDHQRTRLTHALEVAQVARAIAEALRLNVALVEAIALGHDCGHGPGGHASEDALSPYIAGGYDHATFGADVTLTPLNLTDEVLDGIRNHSWSRPAPNTPEGEVVSWADRIAYLCHDFEDAVHAKVVSPGSLPPLVRELCGSSRGSQLGTFIGALIRTSEQAGVISMSREYADALGEFRRFNYEEIYLRPESLTQGRAVVGVLRTLVDHLVAHPDEIPLPRDLVENDPVRAAVSYVSGMTDRFAFDLVERRLAYNADAFPRGVDFDRPKSRSNSAPQATSARTGR